MKKNFTLTAVVFSVFCLVLFAGAALVQAADMDKGMMMDNSQMMMDTGKMLMDKGKAMYGKGMKTEGNLMIRDGKMLMRHGKHMKDAAGSGKMLPKEQYEPEKEFKGWLEDDQGGG
jgi:hypothetical protein